MLNDFQADHVYIACGYTDLRWGIDGLASVVESQFHPDPFSRTLFLFCGRRSDRIKALYFKGDGFVLLYKRLENGSFQWPRNDKENGYLDMYWYSSVYPVCSGYLLLYLYILSRALKKSFS